MADLPSTPVLLRQVAALSASVRLSFHDSGLRNTMVRLGITALLGSTALHLSACERCTSSNQAAGAPSGESPDAAAPPASRVPPAAEDDLRAGRTIVERIPLGQPCVFELGESKDPKGLPIGPSDRWSKSRSRKDVRCSFRVHSTVPVVDVRVLGQPGDYGVDSVQIGTQGPGVSVFQDVEYANELRREIETIDVNFDGYLDLRILRSVGSIGCFYHTYFVFNRERHEESQATAEAGAQDADLPAFERVDRLEDLCNVELHPATKAITATDLAGPPDLRFRWKDGELVDDERR